MGRGSQSRPSIRPICPIASNRTNKTHGTFVDKRSRTTDQMVQAARSGKQNTVEGSMASATSKKTEIKLTNVARASLEELLVDYCDFLRVNRMMCLLVSWPALSAVGRYFRMCLCGRSLCHSAAPVALQSC